MLSRLIASSERGGVCGRLHGSGPGRFATPSLYDSFIRYSMPVYPGAIQAVPPAPPRRALGLRASSHHLQGLADSRLPQGLRYAVGKGPHLVRRGSPQPGGAAAGTELTLDELSNKPYIPFTAVGHNVAFDDAHGRKLWYCDIQMDMGEAYFPLVRPALARQRGPVLDAGYRDPLDGAYIRRPGHALDRANHAPGRPRLAPLPLGDRRIRDLQCGSLRRSAPAPGLRGHIEFVRSRGPRPAAAPPPPAAPSVARPPPDRR